MSWVFYALLSAVFASLVAVFGKVGIANIDSTLATAVRAVIMAVFLALTAVFMGKMPELSSIDSKAILYIVFSGVAGALSWLFYFYALRSGPVAGVASLDRLSLVFAIVFAALFLGERISWGAALGAALMVGGAMLVAAK